MEAKLLTVRIGSTMFVCDETTIDKIVKEYVIPDGPAATLPGGWKEWMVDEPVIDTSKSGSEAYSWDRSGNKVKHARCRYRQAPCRGEVTRTVEAYIYKQP